MGVGLIYGTVSPPNGRSAAGITVDLNWVQREGGGPALSVGGDPNLTSPTPRALTTQSGRYAIPFYWASEQIPGSLASAHAMSWQGNDYLSLNMRGLVVQGIDLIGVMNSSLAPNAADPGGAASAVFSFMVALNPELAGVGMVIRLLSGTSSIDNLSIVSNIDFVF